MFNTQESPNLKFIKYKFIIFELYVVIFGGIILKLIHIPNQIGLTILSCFDSLPLLVWLLLNPRFKSQSNIVLNKFSIWLIIGSVMIPTFVIDYIHNTSITSSLGHFGALIRYIPLCLMTIDIGTNNEYIEKLIKKIKIIAIILIIISYLCIILGEKAFYLLPILPSSNTASRSIIEGEISGIFPNTIDLSFCLIILYIFTIYTCKINLRNLILFSIIFSIPIYYTGSIASFAIICLLFLYYLKYTNSKYFYLIFIISSAIATIAIATHIEEIILIYDVAKLSRLGILTITLPNFISELSVDTFFGIGTNIDIIYAKVNSYPEKVHILEYMYELGGFADVYWFALIIYHGIIGFIFLFILFYKIFHALLLNTKNKKIKTIINSIWITILLLGFFNQILVVKQFTIFFWIIIGIIYAKEYYNYSNGNKLEKIFKK